MYNFHLYSYIFLFYLEPYCLDNFTLLIYRQDKRQINVYPDKFQQ